jgi:DNA end-binding protein Ku
MARAIWSGSISFGLVSVPVKVLPAVREHTVHFHQVDKKTGSRIRYEKIAEKSGREADASQIELGYEIEDGDMVVLESQELDELRPATTRTIDIADFVDLSEVDPVFYARPYWLAPDGEPATRPYRLLVAAMEQSERVGIGMVVMRNKQYLAAVRSRDGALALSTMHFDDEIVARSKVPGLPAKSTKADARELKLARQIIDSRSGPWKPKKYHDTYTEEVRKLIRAHEKDNDIVVEEQPAARAQVIDLMDALQASVRATTAKGDRVKAVSKAAAQLESAAQQDKTRSGGAKSTKRTGTKATKMTSPRGSSTSSHSKSSGRVPKRSSSARKSA